MREKKLILFIFYFFIFTFIYSANLIILRDGSEYKGVLLKIDDNYVYFRTINGEEKKIDKSNVERILFQSNRLYTEVERIEQVNDNEIRYAWEKAKKYNDKGKQVAIILDKLTVEFISEKKAKINIKKIYKILNEAGKVYSTQYFYYFKNVSEAKLLYAFTIRPDGLLSHIEETAINDEPMNNEVPVYDLLHRVKFGLKDVEVGSLLVWEGEIIQEIDPIKIPFFIEKELVSEFDVERRIIRIIGNKSLKFSFAFYDGLIEYKKPNIEKRIEKDKIIYEILQNEIKAFIIDEEKIPDISQIIPKFYGSLNFNWQEINEKYSKIFDEKSDLFNNLAQKIVGDEKDKDRQIELLYDYINRKIVLVDVLPSEYYYVPNNVDILINSSALNVLDKSFLFYKLAESLNIKCNFLFYRKNYKNKIKIVSMRIFDSTLCEVFYKGEKKYISFENPNLNLGQVPYSISNAFALLIAIGNPKLKILEEIKAEENLKRYTYKCEAKENNFFYIEKKTEIIGYDQVYWREKRFLLKEELDKEMKERVKRLDIKAELVNYNFEYPLDCFDKPIILKEQIEIKDYSFDSGNIYKLFKIPEFYISTASLNKEKRVLPYNIGRKEKKIYFFEIKIPENFKVEFLPESIKIKRKEYFFFVEFLNSIDKINIKIEITYFYDTITPFNYKRFKMDLEKIASISKEWLFIRRR